MKNALESLDALEAVVRRLTERYNQTRSMIGEEILPIIREAYRIVSELPEQVDPDLVIARNIIAEAQAHDADGQHRAKRYQRGDWDTGAAITFALTALRRAREEGVRWDG